MAQDRITAWETLFRRALGVLDAAAAHGMPVGAWSFGGGTVLMRRHRHRVSKDIDIFVPDPQLLGYLSLRLNSASESLTGDYVEEASFLKLYFPEGEIDFVVSGFLTPDPTVAEWIAGRRVLVEMSAEIIAKKIWHRGAAFTARDLFDFALVAERDEALREEFEALDVLDFRPSFDDCIAAIEAALAQGASPPHRAEQTLAWYCVTRRVSTLAGSEIRT